MRPHRFFHSRTLSCFVLLLVASGMNAACRHCFAQLRIVSYNTTISPGAGLDVVLPAIGQESINGIARPIDVLALQEQITMTTTTQQIVDVLNNIYGPGSYRRGTLDGQSFGAGRPGLIYNTRTVQLIQEVAIGRLGSGRGPRQTLRYRLRPVGYDRDADFYLYNSHFKGLQEEPNPGRRDAEAKMVRANADSLGDGVPIVYAGDLNLYRSLEPAYQTLLARGNGRAFDPLNRPGPWHNAASFHDLHTQSTTRAGGENRAGGGVDDRFDFQLVSRKVLDGEGFSYIGPGVPDLHIKPQQHSYHAFGNDGTHRLNGDISTGSGASPDVLSALQRVSDHLPVVADYQLPARLGVAVDPLPPQVLRDSEVRLSFSVENTAPVSAAIGADRLQFSAMGSGAVQGAVIDIDDPLNGGKRHAMRLDTSRVGVNQGSLFVGTKSAQVPESVFEYDIGYEVLDHSNASFDPVTDLDVLTLPLGTVPKDSGGGMASAVFEIANLRSTLGLTAKLDLQPAGAEGDVVSLAVDVAPTQIGPGESAEFRARLDTTVAGDFSSTWIFAAHDQRIPGAAPGTDLVLFLTGTVTDRPLLQAGDADQNLRFDQIDLVQVLQAAKYLTGEDATWNTGDWNSAPGGQPGSPPAGDGRFDQRDIVAALQNGLYLQAPYAVTGPSAAARAAPAVPEPSACILAAWAVVCAIARPHRPRSNAYRFCAEAVP